MDSVKAPLNTAIATLFAGKDSVKAEGKAKDGQKVTKENSGEGVCARIATFVKNVFANILYYLSCTMIDFRAKPLMFKDSKVIHAFTAKMSDADLLAQIKGTFTKETLAKIDDRFFGEVAHAIKTAQKEGLATVEYRISFSDDKGLTLEVFAPSHLKTDKLPKLDKAQNETYGEAVKAGAWKKDQKVKVTKDREVTCSVKTISFNATKLPVRLPEDMGDAEEKLKEQAKQARDLEKAVKTAKGGKTAHPDDAPLEQQARRVAALQTLLGQTNAAKQAVDTRAQEEQRAAKLEKITKIVQRATTQLETIDSQITKDEKVWLLDLLTQFISNDIEANLFVMQLFDEAPFQVIISFEETADLDQAQAILKQKIPTFVNTSFNVAGELEVRSYDEHIGDGGHLTLTLKKGPDGEDEDRRADMRPSDEEDELPRVEMDIKVPNLAATQKIDQRKRVQQHLKDLTQEQQEKLEPHIDAIVVAFEAAAELDKDAFPYISEAGFAPVTIRLICESLEGKYQGRLQEISDALYEKMIAIDASLFEAKPTVETCLGCSGYRVNLQLAGDIFNKAEGK